MFDGSYRSKPRAVNLGTNRNRNNNSSGAGSSNNNRKRNSNTNHGNSSSSRPTLPSTAAAATKQLSSHTNNSSRDSILNEAHRLRIERHQKLQNNKAAIHIQRLARGRRLRKKLVQLLYHRIMGYSHGSSSTLSFNMNVEAMNMATDSPTAAATATDTAAENLDAETMQLDNADPNIRHQADISTLLNVYLRLQPLQEHQQQSNVKLHQEQQLPTLQLLRQFSNHIQEHHHPKKPSPDDNVDRTRNFLNWIAAMSAIILSDLDTSDSSTGTDFVLQVRPNTYHIFKTALQLIPKLFVRQRALLLASTTTAMSSPSPSSPWSSEILSTNDIMIIMTYMMQLHQYPTKYSKSEPQGELIQSVVSIRHSQALLGMMIGALTSIIDASGRERGITDNEDEVMLNDDPKKDLLVLRLFLESCIAIYIVHQPNMQEWCRPILGTVRLICQYFHIKNFADIDDVDVLSNFRYYLPDFLKVLRPIPPPPWSSSIKTRNAANDSSYVKENEVVGKIEEQFVNRMISHLISQYRMPFLLLVSRAMSGEMVGSIPEAQNDEPSHCDGANAGANAIQGPYRTRKQKEIMFLSLCVQFLKFLLLDSTASMDDTDSGSPYPQRESDWIEDNHCHLLLWMMQCTVRGDNSAREEAQFSDNNPTAAVNIASDGMLDNDDDADQAHHQGSPGVHRQPPTHTPATSTTRRTTTAVSSSSNPTHRRLTKHDLLTLPKLDKNFTDTVKTIDHMITTSAPLKKSNVDTLQKIARQVCDPIAWLRWGNLLLSNVTDTLDDMHIIESDMEYNIVLRHGQDDYVALLVILLQATTCLRTQQNALSSPFLKVIPFSSVYIANLWKYVMRQSEILEYAKRTKNTSVFWAPQSFLTYDDALEGFYGSMSLFSDLFAHHLIAISDEQFVTLYTTLQASVTGNDNPVIFVNDVILRMRTILNELYWTKPVSVSDLKVISSPGLCRYIRSRSTNLASLIAASNEHCIPFIRARLMITGTKLYNALYERWCRSVTYSPFCDESLWWFPAIQSFTMVDNLISRGDTIESAHTERTTFVDQQQHRQRDLASRRSRNEDSDPMDIDESSSDEEIERNHPNIDEESDRLAAAFSDPKMARLLGSIPQVLPFDRRVKMFDSLIRTDKLQSQDEASDLQRILNAMIRGEDGDVPGRKSVKIRRDELYSDSMEQLNQLGPKLKGRVHVSFTNQVGTDEAGIDGGGVFKEFIDDLIKDAFSVGVTTAQHNLFSATPYQTLTVNTELLNDETLLSHYEFLGRVLGKAVYESILVEAQFCLPFLNQILGKTNTIEDLKNLDLEYYTNLKKLLNMSKSDIESLCLTFELTIAMNSSVKTIELIPNGGNISVSKSNVVQYVLLVSHYRLNVLTFHQTHAFLRGFRDLIPASWVRLFSSHELQKVISGDDSIHGIDVPSLKKVMQYAAGYHPSQSVIEWFWEIIEDEMTADQQRKFLKFMTSCSRQPLLGFSSLEPAPCIQQIRLPDSMFAGRDDEVILKEAPLPTSSTCMNLFKLPNYHSKDIMRRKILAAIESGAGFELT